MENYRSWTVHAYACISQDSLYHKHTLTRTHHTHTHTHMCFLLSMLAFCTFRFELSLAPSSAPSLRFLPISPLHLHLARHRIFNWRTFAQLTQTHIHCSSHTEQHTWTPSFLAPSLSLCHLPALSGSVSVHGSGYMWRMKQMNISCL